MMEEKEIKTIEYIHYCDLCLPQKVEGYGICDECKRVICKDHVIIQEEPYGDYSEYYCKDCAEIKKPFDIKINELQYQKNKIHDEMEEALEKFRESLIK